MLNKYTINTYLSDDPVWENCLYWFRYHSWISSGWIISIRSKFCHLDENLREKIKCNYFSTKYIKFFLLISRFKKCQVQPSSRYSSKNSREGDRRWKHGTLFRNLINFLSINFLCIYSLWFFSFHLFFSCSANRRSKSVWKMCIKRGFEQLRSSVREL